MGPIVLGGMLIFLADRAREVLSFYRAFIASAPDELGGGCAFVTASRAVRTRARAGDSDPVFIPEHKAS